MATVRRVRTTFTAISRSLLQDKSLSFACRGLIAYLLSKPDDWECQVTDIEREGGIRKTARRKLFKEAELAGYLVFAQGRDGAGRFTSAYTVYEMPVNQDLRTNSWLLNDRLSEGYRLPPGAENRGAVNQGAENRESESRGVYMISELQSSELQSSDVLLSKKHSVEQRGRESIAHTNFSLPLSMSAMATYRGEMSPCDWVALPLSVAAEEVEGIKNPPPCASEKADLDSPADFSPQSPATAELPPAPTQAPPSPTIVEPTPISASGKGIGKKISTRKLTDPRANHPAIVAIREILNRFPNKILWDQIIASLGDSPDLEKLKTCRIAQVGRGLNSQNVDLLLEWYIKGVPLNAHEERKNNGKSKYADSGCIWDYAKISG